MDFARLGSGFVKRHRCNRALRVGPFLRLTVFSRSWTLLFLLSCSSFFFIAFIYLFIVLGGRRLLSTQLLRFYGLLLATSSCLLLRTASIIAAYYYYAFLLRFSVLLALRAPIGLYSGALINRFSLSQLSLMGLCTKPSVCDPTIWFPISRVRHENFAKFGSAANWIILSAKFA